MVPFESTLEKTCIDLEPEPLPSFGKYQKLRLLGSGNMGLVYAAEDQFTKEPVAIKISHRELTSGEGNNTARKLFFNEAYAAGLLQHPNILRVFDAGIEGEHCFIVMELVEEASTLADHTTADTLLPIREAVRILYKLLLALDYAHSHGIIHRDIKPSNILLTNEGLPKIADFGIALITARHAELTQVSGVLGTPAYMAPEQVFEEAITSSIDIFSLGIVFYQLLTGRHPFMATTLEELRQNISTLNPPPPSTLRHGIPQNLDYIVARMLRKHPAERYRRPLDIAAELGNLFADLDSINDENDLRARFDELRHFKLFKEFSDQEIWELLHVGSWRTYGAGDHILNDGDQGDSVYVVLSGSVAIVKNGIKIRDGIGQGECFGELGYLGNARRTADVIARTPEVAVMRISASSISAGSASCQIKFLNAFVRVLAQRLRDTTERLITFDSQW
jgi:serine/threonine protein kinase